MADKSNGDNAVTRVTKLPVVESTLNVASNMYSRVKDSHSMVNSVLNTAESAVYTAKEAVQPITAKFEGPIKKVDSIVCSGLDYVENKIPQIKLPPQELYESAKNTVFTTVEPAVKCVCHGVQKVKDFAGLNGSSTVEPCAAGDQCINSGKNSKSIKKPENQPNDGLSLLLVNIGPSYLGLH